MTTNTGTLAISLDTELAWGGYGTNVDLSLSRDGSAERECVQRLLQLFANHEVPVTWAIVGHMFLEECDGTHSEMVTSVNPEYSKDWYDRHKSLNSLSDNPLLHGNDIVESILESDVDHEIATHTFTHMLCDRSGVSSEMLKKELEKCIQLGESHEEKITTLVYPRNNINFLQALPDSGISIFRGHSPEELQRNDSLLGHAMVYARSFTRKRVPTVSPQQVLDGLWMLPASLQLEYHPKLSNLQQKFYSHPRVDRIKSGLDHAKEQNEIVHLWGHPHSIDENIFKDIREVISYARSINIEIRTVRDAVLSHTKNPITTRKPHPSQPQNEDTTEDST